MASEVEKQLERAKRAIEKGKSADAIAAYQAVLQAAPTNIEAMQALGDLFIQQNEPVRAANYYGLLFDRLADSREEPKAVALYTRFLRSSEQPPERQARYAAALQKQNKPGEAIEHFSVAAEHFIAKGKEDDACDVWSKLRNWIRQTPNGKFRLRNWRKSAARARSPREVTFALDNLRWQRARRKQRSSDWRRANAAMPDDRDVALLYAQALMMSSEVWTCGNGAGAFCRD